LKQECSAYQLLDIAVTGNLDIYATIKENFTQAMASIGAVTAL